MKIVFVTTESLMDHSYTMANELRKKNDIKTIITAKTLTPELSAFCKMVDAIFVKRTRFINPLSLINEINLMNSIRKQKADLIWFDTFSFYQSVLAKFFFKKIVVNAHDIDLHPEESDYHGILSQKVTFSRYRKSIAVMSEIQREIFKNKYGFSPFLLQLPFIDYYEAAANDTGAKKRILKPGDKVKFFFFGSVLAYKGIERLIDAAEMLEKKGLNFEVNIYGRLKYDAGNLEAGINKVKSITHVNKFIDYKDVYKIYRENDVIIIPYIHVSQCGPLLIGFNQNVPVICSDLPGFREYVDEGNSGLLFDNTAEGLAQKMEEIINNPQMINDMSEYINTSVRKKFSMLPLSSDYISVFKKVLDGTD